MWVYPSPCPFSLSPSSFPHFITSSSIHRYNIDLIINPSSPYPPPRTSVFDPYPLLPTFILAAYAEVLDLVAQNKLYVQGKERGEGQKRQERGARDKRDKRGIRGGSEKGERESGRQWEEKRYNEKSNLLILLLFILFLLISYQVDVVIRNLVNSSIIFHGLCCQRSSYQVPSPPFPIPLFPLSSSSHLCCCFSFSSLMYYYLSLFFPTYSS